MSNDPKIWLAALISIGIYSYLYKENPFFRACEHIYLGLSLAHLAVMGWTNIRDLGLNELAQGNYLVLIPLVLGILLFTRFSPKISWLSRYSLAYFVGVASGVTITGVIDAGIISQIRGAVVPLKDINSVVAFLCNIAAITTFFFIVGAERSNGKVHNPYLTKIIQRSGLAGRVVLMVSFGAVFGTTVMARLGLFIPRLTFLFSDWIHLIPRAQ
ncbi:MAG: hypothetical protein ACOX3V_02730 [Bacillota bacterium]|jgi:hypothetical protein